MIFDEQEANRILNATGMPRQNVMCIDANAARHAIFNEMVELSWQPGYDDTVDYDTDEELHDFIDEGFTFEMKDLDFCLVYEQEYGATDPCIMLYVSYRLDPSWDQHMEVAEVDRDNWQISMEQMWEYKGDKTIAELRKEFEAAGGTYSEKLETFYKDV